MPLGLTRRRLMSFLPLSFCVLLHSTICGIHILQTALQDLVPEGRRRKILLRNSQTSFAHFEADSSASCCIAGTSPQKTRCKVPTTNAKSCESVQGNTLSSTVAKVLRGRKKIYILSHEAQLAALASVGKVSS